MDALKKELGLWDVFSIAAGAMVSSGLFVLPGLAFALTGPSVVLAYALAALLYLPAICAQAELATAMPKSGGSYFSVERSLGSLAGTIAGFSNWLSTALKAAFAFIGIGTLAIIILGHEAENGWIIKGVAVASCICFAALNTVSVKGAGHLQKFLVVGLIGILVYYVAIALPKIEVGRFENFLSGGWRQFLLVTGMVFVSYGGLTKVVDVGEEIENPKRNIPLGMFIAFVVVNILYVLAVFATVGIVDKAELAGSLAPIALGAGKTGGAAASYAIGVAALLAYATTGNAGILSSSRSPMAMSRDGLLPESLSRMNKRFGTPHVAILLTAVLMVATMTFLSINDLVKTASTMLLISFVLMNISVLVMRGSRIEGYRPSFHAPLFPYFQIGAVLVYCLLVLQMGWVPLIMAGAFLFGVLMWYLTYVSYRIDRESAIIYMVKNILSKHIGRGGIEEELKHITLVRDEVELDRFDQIVADCP
ncbi:MAG: amino acid permease, partial [Planctomycetes bacterium]|nr:amino acid permease [Planctomycetota bacterium]